MFNKESVVEGSDTRDDDSSNQAGYKILKNNFKPLTVYGNS